MFGFSTSVFSLQPVTELVEFFAWSDSNIASTGRAGGTQIEGLRMLNPYDPEILNALGLRQHHFDNGIIGKVGIRTEPWLPKSGR